MTMDCHQKITARHLQRDAYLYVRQSTLRQVMENTESTQRQYALRQQAVRLGWSIERVIVIDSDLGQSGASAADREGFQRLVTEVSLGHAGIVLGLEVSRLARNSTDWHRLLEICALTDTLILDEDGLYDPRHFNDRLLLGMKGTLSEAELHVLHARLQGGIVNKARRGELRKPLPVGLAYDEDGRVGLDPDRQIQQALRTFFQTYERLGAATATMTYFRQQDLLFPRRVRQGIRKGELVWTRLTHSLALKLLRNPRYAGCYVHGRSRTRRTLEGKSHVQRLPLDQWDTVLPGSHPGYITWEQFQRNQQRLRECAQAHGVDRRQPAREGPALLQGLVVCGVCGQKMTVRYHAYKGGLRPEYICQRDHIEYGRPLCQSIPGADIDRLIGELLLQLIEPMTLEVSLAVQQELQTRLTEADRLRQQQVERARYEADLTRQRYLKVDPNNRLVADALEADWNEKLRLLQEAQARYEQQRVADRALLDAPGRASILALAADFPKVWHDSRTPDRERKRMVRLLLEDVTLVRGEQITVHICFKGGARQTRIVPLPLPGCRTWQTDPLVVALIDRLLDENTDRQIAAALNTQGHCTGKGLPFTGATVTNLRHSYGLKSRFDRLRERGLLTEVEMAERLGAHPKTIRCWRRAGLLRGEAYDDRNRYLYEPISAGTVIKHHGMKLSDSRRVSQIVPETAKEV